MYANARKKASRKSTSRKGKPAKRKTSKTRKVSAKVVTSKSGKQWTKKGGKWVVVGGKKPSARKSATKSRAKAGKRPWPKKGGKGMKRAVAGVEARVGEDLVKAQKLVQSARYRVKNTAKAAGGKSGVDKLFTTVVKALERLITEA